MTYEPSRAPRVRRAAQWLATRGAAKYEPGSCEKRSALTRRFGRLKARALQHNVETCAVREEYSPSAFCAVRASPPRLGSGARRQRDTTRTPVGVQVTSRPGPGYCAALEGRCPFDATEDRDGTDLDAPKGTVPTPIMLSPRLLTCTSAAARSTRSTRG
jgi:hypothetical protein